MFPFRKILFPVDYSEPCEEVIPYVTEMARHFSADLTLLHAYGAEALGYSALPLTDPELPHQARCAEEKRLRDFALETFPGQHVETFVELGEAAGAIDRTIERQTTDLVMLPTHGWGPVRRFLLGSVATKVLHDVSAAVWTCSAEVAAKHQTHVAYESILCAVDASDEAVAVLKAAAAFACSYKAALRLVRVVETPATSMDIDFACYKKDLLDEADFELRELKGQFGINVPHTVIDGSVSSGIREEALLRKADLVIAGRGLAQATFERVWSHIYPIVRQAPCPVLSI